VYLLYDTAIKPIEMQHERIDRTRMINTSTVYLMIATVLSVSLGTVSNAVLLIATASPESDSGSSSSTEVVGVGESDQGEGQEPEEDSSGTASPVETPAAAEQLAAEPEPKEPEPEAEPEGANDGATAAELPKCDGSFQDCVTDDGNICTAGQGGHECECAEDMSDCPNHPSLKETPPAAPDQDCLFDPSLPKCTPPPGEDCPEGFFTNEDGQCFPAHPNGCPKGYHSHEDDESGRCIPNSTPCDPGYVINPDYPECRQKAAVCHEHPEAKVCGGRGGGDGDDDDTIIKIRNNINNINVIKTTVKNDPAAFEVDLVAIGMNSDGSAMKCLMDVNRAEADCEEFAVPSDRVSGTITEFIEYESGANDRAQQNSYLNSLKQNINDIGFIEDNVDNKDLGVDIAATGINQDGKGMECLINTDEDKAECEEFTVPADRISGQITEIVEFD
jgi:hypothetical protein